MARYRFTPNSKLPQQGPFVIAANHFTEIDPVAVAGAVWHLGRLPRFMAKESLFRIPVVGWVLRATGQIPVDRSRRGSTSQLISAAATKVRGTAAGRAHRKSKPTKPVGDPLHAANEVTKKQAGVIVYPEGTLTRDPDLWPMRGKNGAVRLALLADIPLYPMAHWGSQELMPRYARGIRPFPRKTITVSVGEPIDLSSYRGKPLTQQLLTEATDHVMNEITRLLAELRGLEPPTERWDPVKHQQSETGRFE